MQPVGLLLLAAGSSARLGRPKQLLPYRGRSLLRHAATVAAAAGCHPNVLVTGALHETLLPEVAGLGFEVTHNNRWASGMGSSIRAGLAALEALAGPERSAPNPAALPALPAPPLAAVLVMLCDQPLLTPDILTALLAQFRATGQPVVASAYGGTRGVPAVFGRAVFPALRALSGPAGARDLLRAYAHLPAVPFPAGVVDVDTAAQYEALGAG